MLEQPASITIFGLDFTSAPSARKPITCAQGVLSGATLTIQACQPLTSLAAFATFLESPGPWLAACDFPFGLPRELLLALDWPLEWSAYVRLVSSLSMPEFVDLLSGYGAGQPAGHKLLKREADQLAGARSPMMWFRVPVAKMFFTGAPRLLAAPISVLPCRPLSVDRIVLEGYPALVARKLIDKQSYKNDGGSASLDEVQFQARKRLITALTAATFSALYDVMVVLEPGIGELLLQDRTGDYLDAVLCAAQVAWAYHQPNYGIPGGHELDGWIVYPALL